MLEQQNEPRLHQWIYSNPAPIPENLHLNIEKSLSGAFDRFEDVFCCSTESTKDQSISSVAETSACRSTLLYIYTIKSSHIYFCSTLHYTFCVKAAYKTVLMLWIFSSIRASVHHQLWNDFINISDKPNNLLFAF